MNRANEANEAEEARFLGSSRVGDALSRHSAASCRLYAAQIKTFWTPESLEKGKSALTTKIDDGKLGPDERNWASS